MLTPNLPITILLGALGVIPFAAATYLSWTDHSFGGISAYQLFSTYSAIILSFLGGALWGQLIHDEARQSVKYLLIASNVIALIAWCALLLETPALTIALLLLGYISIYWVEARSLKWVRSPNSSYLNMRLVITSIVCVLHILMLYPHY